MDVPQLRYFVAVAEELSFSRAALRLHISQPPLSRQIANLERELGLLLLERTKRQVRLTDAGRVFLDQTRDALAALARAADAAKRAARGEIGELSLAFGGSAAYVYLPEILRVFRDSYPQIELRLHTVPMTQQLDDLRSGRIDIGMTMLPFEDRGLSAEPILRDRLVVALPRRHPLTTRKTIAFRDLAGETFIGFPRQALPGYCDRLAGLCGSAGFAPRIAKEVPQIETLIGLISAGLGIGIVPAVATKLRISEVEYRPLRERQAYVDFAMVWRQENELPVLQTFLATTRKIMHQRLGKPDRAVTRGRKSGNPRP